MRRGIILAGGTGSRLYPLTLSTSKQLLPVYDKPMIYYPLSVLMLAGVREILIITTQADQASFVRLLGEGARLGMSISYAVQPNPGGLAQALLIAEDFLQGGPSVLVLGDNLFFGADFGNILNRAAQREQGATIFGYAVSDARAYGVVEFDPQGKVLSLEEKPARPKSNHAVTGLYFYDRRASDFARRLRPSKRGELEITDLNRTYLELGELSVELLGRGFAWLDTGTHDSLLEAGEFVRTIEHRQGLRIGSIEEVAFANGWIDAAQLRSVSDLYPNDYGQYLKRMADGGAFG